MCIVIYNFAVWFLLLLLCPGQYCSCLVVSVCCLLVGLIVTSSALAIHISTIASYKSYSHFSCSEETSGGTTASIASTIITKRAQKQLVGRVAAVRFAATTGATLYASIASAYTYQLLVLQPVHTAATAVYMHVAVAALPLAGLHGATAANCHSPAAVDSHECSDCAVPHSARDGASG